MDIERDGTNPPIIKGIGERVFIDQRPPCHIHEACAGAKTRQALLVDELLPGAGRRAQDDAVALAGEALQGVAVDAPAPVAAVVAAAAAAVELGFDGRRLALDVVVQDLHAEGQVHASRDALPDVAEPDET